MAEGRDELNELVVAKSHDELDELVVAKIRGELNKLVVTEGRDELNELIVASCHIICWVFRIFIFDGCNNQFENSRRLVIK